MKSIQPNPAEPFDKNVRNIMPAVLDNFFSFEKRVVGHPARKKEFHDMRIAGKPLRYMIEIIEPVFGSDLKQCLRDIEAILDQMGTIHDCDVAIEILHEYLDELHVYNSHLKGTAERVPLGAIRQMLEILGSKRETSFETLCGNLKRWNSDQMSAKLFNSIAS